MAKNNHIKMVSILLCGKQNVSGWKKLKIVQNIQTSGPSQYKMVCGGKKKKKSQHNSCSLFLNSLFYIKVTRHCCVWQFVTSAAAVPAFNVLRVMHVCFKVQSHGFLSQTAAERCRGSNSDTFRLSVSICLLEAPYNVSKIIAFLQHSYILH